MLSRTYDWIARRIAVDQYAGCEGVGVKPIAGTGIENADPLPGQIWPLIDAVVVLRV